MCIKLCRGDVSYFLFSPTIFFLFFPQWGCLGWLLGNDSMIVHTEERQSFFLVHHLTLGCSVGRSCKMMSGAADSCFPNGYRSPDSTYSPLSIAIHLQSSPLIIHCTGNGAEAINQRGIRRRAKCMYHKKHIQVIKKHIPQAYIHMYQVFFLFLIWFVPGDRFKKSFTVPVLEKYNVTFILHKYALRERTPQGTKNRL